MNKKPIRWGYCTLEVFPEHHEVILSRKPLGSDATTPERVFMSTKGFSFIAKRFLKLYRPVRKKKSIRNQEK